MNEVRLHPKSEDKEIQAIEMIRFVLAGLETRERRRVLNYLVDRSEEEA